MCQFWVIMHIFGYDMFCSKSIQSIFYICLFFVWNLAYTCRGQWDHWYVNFWFFLFLFFFLRNVNLYQSAASRDYRKLIPRMHVKATVVCDTEPDKYSRTVKGTSCGNNLLLFRLYGPSKHITWVIGFVCGFHDPPRLSTRESELQSQPMYLP